MPFIETTMIAGYGPDVKARLVTGFTRAVRSVMAAPLDGVIVVLREVDPSCWARGGVSRTPGPALPAAVDVLSAYAKAAAEGDAGAPGYLDGVAAPPAAASYNRLEEVFGDDGSLVYATGALADGTGVLDRWHVRAGKIVGVERWTGARRGAMSGPAVLPSQAATPERSSEVVVVGAGACGLCAAMAARDAGAEVVVLERDATPSGSTAWSVGMIPAAGSAIQRARGVEDTPERFAADILAKNHGQTDEVLVRRLADASGPAVDWLTQRHGLRLALLEDIVYPGHGCARYHVPPTITGAELQAMLLDAAKASGARVLTGRCAEQLYANPDGRVTAVGGLDDAGSAWTMACGALVLATAGFAANAALVREHIPEMAEAIAFTHPGAQGDALRWGLALGARTADLGSYQGHHLVTPERLPLTWAVIIDGGVQVNAHGLRFADEMRGYSEQAADILKQPGGVVWTLYDEAAARNAHLLETYRTVVEAGLVRRADTLEGLARLTRLPQPALARTLAQVERARRGEIADPFGRDVSGRAPLQPPFLALPTTGALYHTQGGLAVDPDGRVLREDGRPFPNLFAGGGAARGVSGPAASGYLGGNGLLSAVVLGRLAGAAAAHASRV